MSCHILALCAHLIVATAAVIAAIAYVKSTLTHRQQEKYKAEELVAVVLRRLQDQVSHCVDVVPLD